MTCETEYQVSTITTSQFEFTNTVSQMKYRTNEPGISRSLQSLLIASTIQSVELTADVFVSILQKSTCYQRASQDFFFFFLLKKLVDRTSTTDAKSWKYSYFFKSKYGWSGSRCRYIAFITGYQLVDDRLSTAGFKIFLPTTK